jgi:hypothetical protein
MRKPSTIQTEIRVADLLAFYRKHATSHFLCFNVAKMLVNKLEQHPDWEKHCAAMARDYTVLAGITMKQSGFYYYDFMDIYMNRSRFEELILDQLQDAINKYSPGPNGDWEILSHADINFLADIARMEPREYRDSVLSKWLEADPEAVLTIEV